MTFSWLHKVLPMGLDSRNLAPKAQSGMTLLEVLIAVLLFAVFSGVFMTVTEMLGVLVPASKADDLPIDCMSSPKAIDSAFRGGWPDDYRICIYPYQGLSESDQKRPGLYLLQAEATEPAFWRKPVQRLFCKPYHLCLNP
jgi:prepilin-type N-terminal cleavage/methylation domain-containing protein